MITNQKARDIIERELEVCRKRLCYVWLFALNDQSETIRLNNLSAWAKEIHSDLDDIFPDEEFDSSVEN